MPLADNHFRKYTKLLKVKGRDGPADGKYYLS
jgi:hypothetical protein